MWVASRQTRWKFGAARVHDPTAEHNDQSVRASSQRRRPLGRPEWRIRARPLPRPVGSPRARSPGWFTTLLGAATRALVIRPAPGTPTHPGSRSLDHLDCWQRRQDCRHGTFRVLKKSTGQAWLWLLLGGRAVGGCDRRDRAARRGTQAERKGLIGAAASHLLGQCHACAAVKQNDP